jgi:hypothetical protein
MEFVSTDSDSDAQVIPLIEQGHRLPFGSFVGFFLAYELLDLISQETADGSGPPSGADLRLLNRFSVKTDRQILLPVPLDTRHDPSCARDIRVARIARAVKL